MVLFFFCQFFFLKENDKERVQKGGWEDGKHQGGVEGGKTEIRIYFIKN